eukprot:scaffold3100_cov248-Pinguiococcus_pyrenoidosus.AAC.8
MSEALQGVAGGTAMAETVPELKAQIRELQRVRPRARGVCSAVCGGEGCAAEAAKTPASGASGHLLCRSPSFRASRQRVKELNDLDQKRKTAIMLAGMLQSSRKAIVAAHHAPRGSAACHVFFVTVLSARVVVT